MITLSSDFGSPYPAAMKGVILDRPGGPNVRLVDVAHDFPRQDVRATAFWLREVLPWFPPAVHLVVVDPGVGTDRAAIAIRAGDHALVGPDNGVLVPVARELAGPSGEPGESDEPGESGGRGGSGERGGSTDGSFEVFEIAVSDPGSHTFHGRDVFAPAAAEVHEAGVGSIEGIDGFEPATGFVDLRFPEPDVRDGRAAGEVLVVDGFGNAITNVPGEFVDDLYGDSVAVNGETAPVRRSYARIDPDHRLVTVGSHGNVELAVNQGRGDEAFHVNSGDDVTLVR